MDIEEMKKAFAERERQMQEKIKTSIVEQYKDAKFSTEDLAPKKRGRPKKTA